MQEQSLIYILMFLIAQTITIYKKLSAIEEKIDSIQKHNDKQDEQINKIMRVIAEHINGAARELIT